MPLTEFQARIANLLSVNRSPDSHLAGGAALHFEPCSVRYSNDLDYFHDSPERLASAFLDDQQLLQEHGYSTSVKIRQPSYVRAIISKNENSTKIEWAHDSAWRFVPAVSSKECGYQLHPVDLAVNKVLALAGRNEARDFIDVLWIHRSILPLGPLCWAAVGKDPGFTPLSLLELLRRRGGYRPEDFARLMLRKEVDLPALKTEWLEALEQAGVFVKSRPPDQVGCLYYSIEKKKFIDPSDRSLISATDRIVPHFGSLGGSVAST